MKDFKYFPELIGIYITVSVLLWLPRVFSMDCERRYMDFFFPITKLHCKVNP